MGPCYIEKSSVKSDSSHYHRVNFHLIQSICIVRRSFNLECHRNNNDHKDNQDLHFWRECRKKYTSHYHSNFSEHDNSLPIISPRVVPLEKEPILSSDLNDGFMLRFFNDLFIHQLYRLSILEKKKCCKYRNSYCP